MLRLRLLALSAAAYGLWLFLYHRQWSYWMIDIVFFVLALLLWLGRTRPEPLLLSIGILAVLSLRPLAPAITLWVVEVPLFAVALWTIAPWLKRHLAAPEEPRPAPARSRSRWAIIALVFAGLLAQAARPAWLMIAPERRHKILLALSPSFPIAPPEKLSSLAAALRAHVLALSQTIGERSIYRPEAQDLAKDYIVDQLRAAGFEPAVLDYAPRMHLDFPRRQPFHNVEVLLGPQEDAGGVWVVGAHYDTVVDTPGADDNASGVAVLIEAARLLKASPPKRGVRFVAFGTEEPPSFGTRDMGSERYVRQMQARGVKIRGAIILEMLGYYNDKPGSQLFPPFLSPFYPDRGSFLGLVGNVHSAGLTASVRSTWKKSSAMPLETTILPSVLSTLALSDQLNFWAAGERAVMLSDTSYFRYPHYHQAEDTAEKLDYERMASAAQGLAATLRALP